MAAARLHQQLIDFSQIFVGAYMDAARESPVFVTDRATRRSLLILHVLNKVLHAIDSDARDHPEWIDIPIGAVHAVLDYMAGDERSS